MEVRNMDTVVLQDLFAAQVPKSPNAIAVVDGDVKMTYSELDRLTDTLAVQLVEEYGLGPDVVAGILMPRSVQYVIAYVAVLKAGGAYMPLELVYPKQLLEKAITQTDCKVVLTIDTYKNRLEGHPCIVLGKQAPYFEYTTDISYPPPNYVRPNADNLAFVVMSSGTTGAPKGICQTHRAAIHSYEDRLNRYPYHMDSQGQPDDRVGAGVFFVWELFRPLCRGATCVCIPDHVLFDPQAVTIFVQKYDVTRILVTPSLMQLILDSVDRPTIRARLSHLRYLWFCGEVVSTDLATACGELLPNVELMNLYSISECHDVSIGDLKRELDLSRKYATCGKQIPGVEFYIVDLEEHEASGEMKLVPNGQKGEVYVGGPVVGRGYLHMPEKTAERFVVNPFSDDPNFPRLYRTGDLGKILPNSHLEILGRCDFMVKIRGYSVVLGAIESALAKHPKLSSAVVLAVGAEGSREGKKLVAYVVPTNWHDAPSASSVRAFLKEHVPPYAIPSTFCVIDALPVAATAAGKLDRKKLPPHESAPRLRAFSVDVTDDQHVPATKQQQRLRLAPQNFTEQAILDIWAELLDLPAQDLSALDSFFEVGGHSLLATKLVGLVNAKFNLSTENGLSIVSVVEDPTIRSMAEMVIQAQEGGGPKVTAKVVDLQAEAESLDPSIYPFPTRKGNTMSRFRVEASALISPRVVFLTGATGWLGAHVLSELLHSGVTVIALARANTNEAAKERLIKTLAKYRLLEGLEKPTSSKSLVNQENLSPEMSNAGDEDEESLIDSNLVAIAGDFSLPLLGMDNTQFKSLALEIDSIIHCGAQVNLMKPYASLKESNVLGTQEILRLATTNGFVKTKVKPVHYISTNGIFPVDANAYQERPICVKEDVVLEDYAPHLTEGYAMTKWVAEKMCTIAEARGLPISVMRPGNMAGSATTGVQNPDDLNFLLIQGMISTGCAPTVDTNYCLDLTPVDYAAKAVVHLAVQAPQKAIGQRFHLQTPQKPVALIEIVEMLENVGYQLDAVTRDEFVERLAKDSRVEQLASGWPTFEPYFVASTWLQYGCDNLQFACSDAVQCPPVDETLLSKWFPRKTV